jgi:SPP1 family predicted phage head-tail adaptor
MPNPLLESGKLNRWITIERATTTRDTDNQAVKVWGTHAARWASAKPAPGTERFQNAETAAEAPMRFVFLFEDNLVTDEDRLLHEDGRRYEISSVTEIGRREGWEVLATARGEDPE